MPYHQDKQARLWGASLLGSVLVHLLLILLFFLMAPELALQMGPPGTEPPRELRIYRAQAPAKEEGELAAKDKEASQQELAAEEDKPQFAKTNADTPEAEPEKPDYIGERSTTISGDEENKGEISDDDAPSLDGEEREDVNTVEQDRQEGDLEFDGKQQSQQGAQAPSQPSPATPPSAPSPAQQVTQPSDSSQITPPTPEAPPMPPVQSVPQTAPPTQQPTPQPAEPTEPTEATEHQEQQPQKEELEQTQEAEEQEQQAEQPKEQQEEEQQTEEPEEEQEEGEEVEEPRDLEEDPDGAVVLPQQTRNSMQIELPELPAIPTSTTLPSPPPSTPSLPRPASAHRASYDPMFTATAQPGFRTKESRSRSSGRFVIGRNAALNVASTPLGRYQELIYRRIASHWYTMIDDRAGDILPGSLTIRILINPKGQVPSIQLISRQGASISQQSLTFDAIRRATIPPMPLDVQKEIVGDKLDFTITFYFD